MSADLKIVQNAAGGVELVKFQGDITAENYALVTAGMAELLKQGKRAVVFDLREVAYISSVGYGALTQSHKNIAAAGGRLAIVHAGGAIARQFRMTNLDRILNLYPDEAAALASFAG